MPKSLQLSLAVSVFYGITSVSISLLNKALLTSYGFDCYFFLLFAQMAASALILHATKDLLPGNPCGIPTLTWEKYKAASKLGILYVGNVTAGFVGLRLINIPTFNTLRRTVSPFVLLYEFIALGRNPERPILASVMVIVLGTVIAAWETLDTDWLGYSFSMINNLLTAAVSVTQKEFSQQAEKPTAFAIVYYNAVVAAPLSLLLGLLVGEGQKLMAFAYLHDSTFWAGFALSSIMGLLITFSTTLSVTYNSPLATCITGTLKDLLTTLIGAVLFTGFVPTVASVTGIVMSFLGAVAYSLIGLRKQLASSSAASSATAAAAAASASAAPTQKQLALEQEMEAGGLKGSADVEEGIGGAGATPTIAELGERSSFLAGNMESSRQRAK